MMSLYRPFFVAALALLPMASAMESTPLRITRSLRQASQMARPAAGWENQMLSLLNQERQKVGAPPLCLNVKLGKAATLHSQDMRANNYFEHNSPSGVSPYDRMKAQGFSGGAMSENIAQGQNGVASVMKAWMDSPGHRKNILNPDYKFVGLGYAGGDCWTQNFGGSAPSERCSGAYTGEAQPARPTPPAPKPEASKPPAGSQSYTPSTRSQSAPTPCPTTAAPAYSPSCVAA